MICNTCQKHIDPKDIEKHMLEEHFKENKKNNA